MCNNHFGHVTNCCRCTMSACIIKNTAGNYEHNWRGSMKTTRTVHCSELLWTTGARSAHIQYSMHTPPALACALILHSASARHFQCTLYLKVQRWVPLQCTLQVHSLPVSSRTVYTADAQTTEMCTNGVLHALTMWKLRCYCTWCTRVAPLVRTKCVSSAVLRGKIALECNLPAQKCAAGAKTYVHSALMCKVFTHQCATVPNDPANSNGNTEPGPRRHGRDQFLCLLMYEIKGLEQTRTT